MVLAIIFFVVVSIIQLILTSREIAEMDKKDEESINQ